MWYMEQEDLICFMYLVIKRDTPKFVQCGISLDLTVVPKEVAKLT